MAPSAATPQQKRGGDDPPLARSKAAKLLRDSPGLRPRLPALLEEAYPDARVRASAETGLPEEAFPAACPFTPDQITGDWLPEE